MNDFVDILHYHLVFVYLSIVFRKPLPSQKIPHLTRTCTSLGIVGHFDSLRKIPSSLLNIFFNVFSCLTRYEITSSMLVQNISNKLSPFGGRFHYKTCNLLSVVCFPPIERDQCFDRFSSSNFTIISCATGRILADGVEFNLYAHIAFRGT